MIILDVGFVFLWLIILFSMIPAGLFWCCCILCKFISVFLCVMLCLKEKNCLKLLQYNRYASVVAIESTSKLDDEQWLAYWIIYSFLTLMEMVLQPLLEWSVQVLDFSSFSFQLQNYPDGFLVSLFSLL